MTKKFDGVIEAVRYKSDENLDCVRVYERRGATYSDHVLIGREDLIQRLRDGKKYVIGRRIHDLAGTFETGSAVTLAGKKGNEFVVVGKPTTDHDHLKGVPLF